MGPGMTEQQQHEKWDCSEVKHDGRQGTRSGFLLIMSPEVKFLPLVEVIQSQLIACMSSLKSRVVLRGEMQQRIFMTFCAHKVLHCRSTGIFISERLQAQ